MGEEQQEKILTLVGIKSENKHLRSIVVVEEQFPLLVLVP